MKSKGIILATALMLGALMQFTACGDQSDREDEEPAARFLIVVAPVEDVEPWKAGYDMRSAAREESRMSEVLVAEDLDDTGTVVIIQSVGDFEADHAVVSEALNLEAESADEPSVTSMRMVELGQQPPNPVAMMLVRRRVADFDAWKQAFDQRRPAREAAGLHTAGVGRGADDNASVFVALFAENLEAARAYADTYYPAGSGDAASVRFVDPIN